MRDQLSTVGNGEKAKTHGTRDRQHTVGNGKNAKTHGTVGVADSDFLPWVIEITQRPPVDATICTWNPASTRVLQIKKAAHLIAFCVYIVQIATEVKRRPHNLVTEEYTSETKNGRRLEDKTFVD